MALDPRARRSAKDYPHSPHPGVRANGYNDALDNLAAQLAAADAISAAFPWVDHYTATGELPDVPELQITVHACRHYLHCLTAHLAR